MFTCNILVCVHAYYIYVFALLCSIMGEGEEVGVVPQFCQELFDRVTGSVIEQVHVYTQSYHLTVNTCTCT